MLSVTNNTEHGGASGSTDITEQTVCLFWGAVQLGRLCWKEKIICRKVAHICQQMGLNSIQGWSKERSCMLWVTLGLTADVIVLFVPRMVCVQMCLVVLVLTGLKFSFPVLGASLQYTGTSRNVSKNLKC